MAVSVLIELAILFVLLSIFTYLAFMLKQPLVVAYLLVGLLSPMLFPFQSFSHFFSIIINGGLIILVFYTALSLDLDSLRRHLSVAFAGAFVATSFIIFLSYWILERFSLQYPDNLYIAIAIAFSSSLLVESFLREKRQIFTLHGNIIQGIITLETSILVLIISLFEKISSFEQFSLSNTFYSLALSTALFLLFFLYLPKLLEKIFIKEEIGLLASITMPFLGASIFSLFGFPYITGAFLIGLALSNHNITLDLMSWIKSLKEFISALFFTSLGMLLVMNFSSINFYSFTISLIISLFLVLVVKPFIVFLILLMNHYKLKTSFLVSSKLTNISELSLVLLLSGVTYNIISFNTFLLGTTTFIVSSLFSVYFQKFEYSFFSSFVSRNFKFLESFFSSSKEHDPLISSTHSKIEANILLCGMNRIGRALLSSLLQDRTKKVVVVDYNHKIINNLLRQGITAIYGDITDPEILNMIDFSSLEIVISTIPEVSENEVLIKEIKKRNKSVFVFVVTYSIEGALSLYSAGADYVAMPHFLGGKYSVLTIEKSLEDKSFISKIRDLHIKELKSHYF